MSWYSLKEKIKFYWQANNAHGLHSPFAFAFYNAVKAQFKKAKSTPKNLSGFSKKENRIISALLEVLKPKQVFLISDEDESTHKWETWFGDKSSVYTAKSFKSSSLNPNTFDLIISCKLRYINKEEFLAGLGKLISNDSVVIIPHIHASKTSISKWESLLKEKQISVSMDLFFIGLLFFRKESTKQAFQLRF